MTLLPEFHQQDAKDTFVKNHPMPPFEKQEWSSLSSAEKWAIYKKGYETSLEMFDEVNEALAELDKLIYSESFCTEGGLSLDDIDLWSRLRSMTLVKDVVWPSILRNYMNNLSASADLPLYDVIAL